MVLKEVVQQIHNKLLVPFLVKEKEDVNEKFF